jgi:hypothetical protein
MTDMKQGWKLSMSPAVLLQETMNSFEIGRKCKLRIGLLLVTNCACARTTPLHGDQGSYATEIVLAIRSDNTNFQFQDRKQLAE